MTVGGYASILATGVCSPLGSSFAATAKAYTDGDRAFAKERALVGADGLPPVLAQAFPLAECRDYGERLLRLFDAAAADCAVQLGRREPGACLALRLVVSPTIAGQPGIEALRLSMLERYSSLFPAIELVGGEAADALSELATATRAVMMGETRMAAVGALDSCIHPALLDDLAAEGRMLMRGNGSGIVPGEAAVIVVVGVPAAGGAALGRMRGVFRGTETEDVARPASIVGRGLADAFGRGADLGQPDRLIVDLDGERWRSEEFAFAVSRASKGESGIAALAADPEAPALQTGSCGTASGLLAAAFALMDAPPRQPDGRLALVSASSRTNGARTVAFIERADAAQTTEAA